MNINWLHIALAAGLVYTGVFACFAAKCKWTWAAMGVALANFIYVLLNLVAPFRGLFDPGYAGYNVGLVQIGPGPMVTVVSGGILIGALSAACIALLNQPGRGMAFVALFDSMLLLAIGLPVLLDGVMAPNDFRIELGEYLQIPGFVAVLLGSGLLCIPLLFSIVWSTRKMRPRMNS